MIAISIIFSALQIRDRLSSSVWYGSFCPLIVHCIRCARPAITFPYLWTSYAYCRRRVTSSLHDQCGKNFDNPIHNLRNYSVHRNQIRFYLQTASVGTPLKTIDLVILNVQWTRTHIHWIPSKSMHILPPRKYKHLMNIASSSLESCLLRSCNRMAGLRGLNLITPCIKGVSVRLPLRILHAIHEKTASDSD